MAVEVANCLASSLFAVSQVYRAGSANAFLAFDNGFIGQLAHKKAMLDAILGCLSHGRKYTVKYVWGYIKDLTFNINLHVVHPLGKNYREWILQRQEHM
jgi:hypothetical protein